VAENLTPNHLVEIWKQSTLEEGGEAGELDPGP